MGNIGFPELLVVALVAFLCIGPRRLPEVARALGEAIRAFRGALKEEREYTPKLPAEDVPREPVPAETTTGRSDDQGPPTPTSDGPHV